MDTQYFKWYSPHLNHDMEIKVYGWGGRPVLFIVRFSVHILLYTGLNNPEEGLHMDNLQLISSLIQEVNGEAVTIFVGEAEGHVGLVQAGTWETLLPFRFDRIVPQADGTLAAWFVIVIIAREFIISGFRLVASDAGIVIAASYWGKFKTVSQMFMIIVLIADLGGVFDVIGTVLIWLSLVLTVVSLVDYVAKNVQVLTKGGM